MDSLTVVGFATRPSFLAAQPNSAFAVRPTGGGAEKQGGGIQGDVALASPEGNAKREENLAGGTKKTPKRDPRCSRIVICWKIFCRPGFLYRMGKGSSEGEITAKGRSPTQPQRPNTKNKNKGYLSPFGSAGSRSFFSFLVLDVPFHLARVFPQGSPFTRALFAGYDDDVV